MSFITISDSLLQENFSWVDTRLEELYYNYGLTAENCDEYDYAGLLNENFAWVDQELETQYNEEFENQILRPTPICWVNYRSYPEQYCIEDDESSSLSSSSSSRRRAESDISDHATKIKRVIERLEFQSPLPINVSPINYIRADEAESVSSMDDNNSEFYCEKFSTITNSSNEELSDGDWTVEDGYDSF